MKKVILLCGPRGCGKNTVSSILESMGYHSLALADPLKEAIAQIFCFNKKSLDGLTPATRLWRETPHPLMGGHTPIEVMQKLGTDFFRNQINKDIWVINLAHRINWTYQSCVVSDVRFPNEIVGIKDRFPGAIAIYIERDVERNDTHESESYFDESRLLCDFVVENNGTIEELSDKVLSVIR